jgi:hypothetical protein
VLRLWLDNGVVALLVIGQMKHRTHRLTQSQRNALGTDPISDIQESVPSGEGGFCFDASSGAHTRHMIIFREYGAIPTVWVRVLLGPSTRSGYWPSWCFGVYVVTNVCVTVVTAMSERLS